MPFEMTNVSARRGGLLALAVLLGMFAAFEIPVQIKTARRDKQYRTMADMRSTGTALEARAEKEGNGYPATRSIEEVARLLEPTYIKRLPRTDAWGNSFYYEGVDCRGNRCAAYVLASAGTDGKLERPLSQQRRDAVLAESSPTRGGDTVFSNGVFVRWPEWIRTAMD